MKGQSRLKTDVSDSDYQHFAEQFTDMVLDSKRPWLLQYLLASGFEIVPTWEELESDEFVITLREKIEADSWFWEMRIFEALMAGDREKLVPYFKKRAVDAELRSEHFDRLLAVGKSSVIKKSLNRLSKRFSFHRGPIPKLPISRYPDVYKTAEMLRPVIQKFLELSGTTSRTSSEILQFLRKDYPVPCAFLLKRIGTFERALSDPGLLSKARKRIPSRARILADAMAGTDHRVTFSTSIERVRQARRLLGSTD